MLVVFIWVCAFFVVFFFLFFLADGAVYHACHKSTYSVLPEDYNWYLNVLSCVAFSCDIYSKAIFSVVKLSYNGIKYTFCQFWISVIISTNVLFLIIIIMKSVFQKVSIMKNHAGLILNMVLTAVPLQFC